MGTSLGAWVGGYQIERLLWSEGQVRVYAARDGSGVLVMLKELSFQTVPSNRTITAFNREADLLRQLEHTAIPRCITSFEGGSAEDTRLYLVHEYVDGQTLEAWLVEHRFLEPELISIADQMLEALAYLHGLSPAIYHRDVRPANIIVRPNGQVMLIGFGSARDLSVTSAGTIAGVVGYVPPAQLAGLVDETSDLYALGMTLIHLFTRRPPWKSRDPKEALGQAEISPKLRAFLARLTAPEASARFQSAREALALLRSSSSEKRRSSPRARAIGIGAICAVAAVGVAMILGGKFVGYRSRIEPELVMISPTSPPIVTPAMASAQAVIAARQARLIHLTTMAAEEQNRAMSREAAIACPADSPPMKPETVLLTTGRKSASGAIEVYLHVFRADDKLRFELRLPGYQKRGLLEGSEAKRFTALLKAWGISSCTNERCTQTGGPLYRVESKLDGASQSCWISTRDSHMFSSNVVFGPFQEIIGNTYSDFDPLVRFSGPRNTGPTSKTSELAESERLNLALLKESAALLAHERPEIKDAVGQARAILEHPTGKTSDPWGYARALDLLRTHRSKAAIPLIIASMLLDWANMAHMFQPDARAALAVLAGLDPGSMTPRELATTWWPANRNSIQVDGSKMSSDQVAIAVEAIIRDHSRAMSSYAMLPGQRHPPVNEYVYGLRRDAYRHGPGVNGSQLDANMIPALLAATDEPLKRITAIDLLATLRRDGKAPQLKGRTTGQRIAVAVACYRAGEELKADDVIDAVNGEGAVDTRVFGIVALGFSEAPEAMRAVARAFEDPNEDVREAAAAAAGAQKSELAVEQISRILAKGCSYPKSRAYVSALGQIGGRRASQVIVERLESVLKDGSTDVIVSELTTALRMASSHWASDLVERADGDRQKEARLLLKWWYANAKERRAVD